ncbi:MAG: hypothetical protein LUE63_00245 [Lachnospiraceae bacterium]|nr:hypothetical protein [Lachnospiraceae bacterium]
MTLAEIAEVIADNPGWAVIVLIVASRLVEISPLKIYPWKKAGKAIGKAINGEVMSELEGVKATQEKIESRLAERERIEDERNADVHRERILQFNLELIRNLKHTKEDFDDILTEIDDYEEYCKAHPDYPNQRAVHAIKNIERVYDDRMKKQDFYGMEMTE